MCGPLVKGRCNDSLWQQMTGRNWFRLIINERFGTEVSHTGISDNSHCYVVTQG